MVMVVGLHMYLSKSGQRPLLTTFYYNDDTLTASNALGSVGMNFWFGNNHHSIDCIVAAGKTRVEGVIKRETAGKWHKF